MHGDRACPIVLDESNRTFVAAATHGAGRAFHIGHEGMLSAPEYAAADGAQLVRNVVAWAGGDSPKIGVEAGMDGLASWLVAEGFDATVASVDALPELDLYIATSYADRSDAEVAAIQAWVEAGGGWVQGGHAWWWAYSNDNVAEDYPGNRILNAMGLTITAATVDAGTDAVGAAAPSSLFHAGRALDAIEAHLDGSAPLGRGEQGDAAATVADAVQQLPFSFALYPAPCRPPRRA